MKEKIWCILRRTRKSGKIVKDNFRWMLNGVELYAVIDPLMRYLTAISGDLRWSLF